MGRQVELEQKRALRTGFYGGARVERGEEFTAPVDFKGKWFCAADEIEKVEAEKAGADPIATELENPIRVVVGNLPNYSEADLKKLEAAELSGQARKGLLAAIGDAIVNRVGKDVDPLS